jgi:DNA primase catalytic subunit
MPGLDPASLAFLQARFATYYAGRPAYLVDRPAEREWMIQSATGRITRHLKSSADHLPTWLAKAAPMHVYHSLACYAQPDSPDMATKHAGRSRWEVLIDLDVTPEAIPGAGHESLSDALARAKQQFLAVLQILEDDLGLRANAMQASFSGSKGYHARLTREDLQQLSQEARSELGRFLGGHNTELRDLFPTYPASEPKGGLKRRIWLALNRIQAMARTTRPPRLHGLCQRHNPTMADADTILDQIRDARDPTAIAAEPAGKAWYAMARHLACPNVDQSAIADASRMVRLQGSLNGKSGLVCRPLQSVDHVERFDPLADANPHARDRSVRLQGLRDSSLDVQGQRFTVTSEQATLPENVAVIFMAVRAARVVG